MLTRADQEKLGAHALRDAEFAALTSRAMSEQARAVVGEVFRMILDEEARRGARTRQRGTAKVTAFKRALGAFLGDLLRAAGGKLSATGYGWVYRSVSPNSFTGGPVSSRHFGNLRPPLRSLGLVEEKGKVVQWTAFGVGRRYATRFRATAKLVDLAERLGVPAAETGRHFVKALPKEPLVLKGKSTQQPGRGKMPGKLIKIEYTDELRAMEQSVKELNSFLDQFAIGGGIHRGYVRVFNVGDHPRFRWNLGGRLYSQGRDSYQQMPRSNRLEMTIDGEPVCELDITASYLTIFQARRGQPLGGDTDPYDLDELGSDARLPVKLFIATTFGSSEFPKRWPQSTVDDYEKETEQDLKAMFPISVIRNAVAKAHPLLAGLRRNPETPPAWAELMYLESEGVFRTMMALKQRHIPSLSVHDSLLVPISEEATARELLEEHYRSATTAAPTIKIKKL